MPRPVATAERRANAGRRVATTVAHLSTQDTASVVCDPPTDLQHISTT